MHIWSGITCTQITLLIMNCHVVISMMSRQTGIFEASYNTWCASALSVKKSYPNRIRHFRQRDFEPFVFSKRIYVCRKNSFYFCPFYLLILVIPYIYEFFFFSCTVVFVGSGSNSNINVFINIRKNIRYHNSHSAQFLNGVLRN